MKKAFGQMNAVMVSVSPWVAERAKASPITKALEHKTVLNGVNTEIFRPRNTADLRKKHGLDGSTRVIFHVTSNFSASETDIKGGRYLIELASRMKNENAVFFVAGNREINFELPKNVIPLGRISDQELLAKYYSLADITVLTSKRETFGMAVAESLCCGTPVAAFLSGGSESIAIDEYCSFAEFGDTDALQKALHKLQKNEKSKEEIARAAKEKYDSRIMAEQYIKIYEKIIEEGKCRT
jgi:glycosyltransferase involved in cell wall biosynthesis